MVQPPSKGPMKKALGPRGNKFPPCGFCGRRNHLMDRCFEKKKAEFYAQNGAAKAAPQFAAVARSIPDACDEH